MKKSFDPQQDAAFDPYASDYHAMHAESIRASGEAPDYFARYKHDVMLRRLGTRFSRPVLDYGCGIGNLSLHLATSFTDVHGYDPSSRSIELAKKRVPQATFCSDEDKILQAHFGAAVVANVLHHVNKEERVPLLERVRSKMSGGGRIFAFEHNPLNPVTRRAVAACEFDADAELLYPWELRQLLLRAGFKQAELRFIVFFPNGLSVLRPLEPFLGWLPAGAQVCVEALAP
jgi:2-polyprenyl-3-methyl-5-hydroxy-6-metoxy-1,4-benzoquinol methylase